MSGPFGSSSFNHLVSSGFYNGVATQSLRLDGGAEITLDNEGSATSNKIATISVWFKRADEITTLAYLFHSKNDGSFGDGSNGLASFSITLDADDNISVVQYNGNPSFNANQYDFGVKTSGRLFRDMSSWYNLVVAIDTTQGSGTTNEADRIKMYINGDQQTVVAINDGSGYQDFADENQLIAVNQDGEQRWGGSVDDSVYAHVYLAEINVVDGLQLTPSNFGETKNGIWIARTPSVSDYGNHGYRLQFKETSVGSGSSSTIGADTSGKNNHFTSTNVSAHDCAMPDSPENNFPTMNEVNTNTNLNLSEGSLKLIPANTADYYRSMSTMAAPKTGKWYWEVRLFVASYVYIFGLYDVESPNNQRATTIAGDAFSGTSDYQVRTSNSLGIDISAGGAAFSDWLGTNIASGDIISFAYDADNNKLWFALNGTFQNTSGTANPATGDDPRFSSLPSTEYYLGANMPNPASGGAMFNFGQDSSFAGAETAQGNADGNGIGDFYYSPPSGYLALCSSNLPEPTIGPNSDILTGEVHNSVVYTGTGSSQAITGVGFQPDFVWMKKYANSTARNHILADSSRGVNNHLSTALTDGTIVNSNGLTAFGTDGFTVGSYDSVNESGGSYIAWNWKINGGTTSSNGSGDITSTVQVNTDAGISIVTYTGFGESVKTVGHGLGVVPKTIWFKTLGATGTWHVYHENAGNGNALYFSGNNAATSDGNFLNNTTPSSSLITLGTSSGANPENVTMVAYCFNEIEGFSKFGAFEGNASTNGPFVYLGFRPRFVIAKCIDNTSAWHMFDPNLDSNPVGYLNANTADHYQDYNHYDILSNGFKIRDNGTESNRAATFVYWAWAENPFKFANAR